MKPTLLIIANHDAPEDQPVDLAFCAVSRFRHGGKWYDAPLGKFLSVGTLVDKFIVYVDNLLTDGNNLPLDK